MSLRESHSLTPAPGFRFLTTMEITHGRFGRLRSSLPYQDAFEPDDAGSRSVRKRAWRQRRTRLARSPNFPAVWKGRGFNQIWRPFHGTQDRFLELNETIETLEFEAIPGDIPNRGLLEADINLHGVSYLQQIKDAHALGPNGKLAGIHIEPGIWLSIAAHHQSAGSRDRRQDGQHSARYDTGGARDSTLPVINHAPPIAPVSITPFTIAPPHNPIQFPETNLGAATQFRTPHSRYSQRHAGDGEQPQHCAFSGRSRGRTSLRPRRLRISTNAAQSALLRRRHVQYRLPAGCGWRSQRTISAGRRHLLARNRQGSRTATIKHQLQYTQTVLLNFNGLSWPHVTVATLVQACNARRK